MFASHSHALPPQIPDADLLQHTDTPHMLTQKRKSLTSPPKTDPFNPAAQTLLRFVSASCLLCLNYHALYPRRPHRKGKTSLGLSKQRRETKGNELQRPWHYFCGLDVRERTKGRGGEEGEEERKEERGAEGEEEGEKKEEGIGCRCRGAAVGIG